MPKSGEIFNAIAIEFGYLVKTLQSERVTTFARRLPRGAENLSLVRTFSAIYQQSYTNTLRSQLKVTDLEVNANSCHEFAPKLKY